MTNFSSTGRSNADRPDAGRPYTKRPSLGAIVAVVILLLIAARWGWQVQGPPPLAPRDAANRHGPAEQTSTPPEALDEGLYTVRRVIDGDTLLMADGVRLRLIGINCPESVKPDSPVEPFGPESSAFTREFIGRQQVRLQFDDEREDQYGRMLAYVFVGDKLLNEELVRAGLARYNGRFRYSESMKRRFRAAQDEARSARRGIWSE